MKTARALFGGYFFFVLAISPAALAETPTSESAVEKQTKTLSRKMALWCSLGGAVALGLGGIFLWSVSETKSPPSKTSEFQFPPVPELPPIPTERIRE